jgi:AcrR family transcriptional regulator
MSSDQFYGRHAASLPSLDGGGEQAARVLPGRRERRKAETREKLFRIAMRLFAERGFFETTTENITAAADVGEGTFFNYFPSKQHILTMLSEKQIEKVITAHREAETGKVSIRQVLHQLMNAIAQEPGRTPALTRSLFTAFISNDEVRELVRNTMARGRGYIAKIIAAGQRRGEVRPERDAAALAMAFQRNVLGTLLLWSMQPKDDLEVWLEETFKDFWAAAENRARRKSNESCNGSSKTPKRPRGKKA